MLHEDRSKLSPETLDMKRAIDSVREELEAIDWYRQRIDAAADENLKGVLRHNMEEEFEHAAMILEWIRQREPVADKYLRKYLFTDSGDLASLD